MDRDSAALLLAQTQFEHPVVLEAGAGTGKTTALVVRVIAWAVGPGWVAATRLEGEEPCERVARRTLRRITAITFSEAAAAEMAHRIGEALRQLERGEAPIGLSMDLLPAENETRRRAAALVGALDQLGVRTIHAFCRRLLAEHPLECGLHPQLVVDADESRQIAIVRQVVEEALPVLFSESDDMLVLAGEGISPRALEEALLDLVRQGVPVSALAEDPLAPARLDPLLGALDRALVAFVELDAGRLEALGASAKTVSATARGLRILSERLAADPHPDPEALDALVAASIDDGIRRDYVVKWVRGDFGKRALAALGAEAEALTELAARLLSPLSQLLRMQARTLVAARSVLLPLYREVERRKRSRGVAGFSDLLRAADELLEGSRGVVRAIREQTDQILVDEFQDTDAIQCRIVRRLALDTSLPGSRPGLFVVGDPKQSIYGWRSADLAAYEAFVDEVEALGGEKADLRVNRRSNASILDEVARIMRPTMQPEPGLQPEFRDLEAGRGDAPTPGLEGRARVEHWVTWLEDPGGGPATTRAPEGAELEARAVAAELVALNEAGVPWKEVGLLFRGGRELETYLGALRAADVPFSVEGDRTYFERREIIEAGALVRCVLDPNDGLALLTLLRSAVVGVPDAALIPLWSRDLPEAMSDLHAEDADALERVRALVEEATKAVPADIPGIERVAGWNDNLVAAARSIASLRASFEEDAADVFVEKLRTLHLFEVTESARYMGAYRVANLDRFFRDVLDALREGEGDPQAVLQRLRDDVAERRAAEEGRPKEAIEDAVQVMTIHKAKGLAFDHVYLLQTHKGRGNQRELRAGRHDGRWEYALLGAETPGYFHVEERRARVEEAERVRTLYVALTRARERLVLSGLHPEFARRPSSESHVGLLRKRDAGVPDLAQAFRRLEEAGASADDAHSTRWVFPALRPLAGRRVSAVRPRADVSAIADSAEKLARLRARARVSMGRSYQAAMSERAHEALEDRWREAGSDTGDPEFDATAVSPSIAVRRDVAMAVGTAVHRALENFDAFAPRDAERERLLAALEGDEFIDSLSDGDRSRGLARARELLDRFFAGPLFDRFLAVAPGVIARELPVLLASGGGDVPALAPTGFLAGAVDLVYRDPELGQLVVADYKTDRVEPGELEERCRDYASQGKAYVDAVEQALGLEARPRFELWLIDSGECRVVETR